MLAFGTTGVFEDKRVNAADAFDEFVQPSDLTLSHLSLGHFLKPRHVLFDQLFGDLHALIEVWTSQLR
jgi:hypothetical protein